VVTEIPAPQSAAKLALLVMSRPEATEEVDRDVPGDA
jgi:hypothetical protein